jgi:hypothetical protein
MKNFYVYQLSNGQIIYSGTCQESDLDKQNVPTGCVLQIIENYINWSDFYVLNNALVSIPEKPNQDYVFNYTTKQWEIDVNKLIFSITRNRNSLLLASDWTQLPNNPLTPELQAAWATYRQQLRDITSQSGYPTNVVWPTAPE